jgi:hypothetical protein
MDTRKSHRFPGLSGAEINNINAAEAKTEAVIVFQLRFLTIKKTIRGAKAMLWGFVNTAAVNANTESVSFD